VRKCWALLNEVICQEPECIVLGIYRRLIMN